MYREARGGAAETGSPGPPALQRSDRRAHIRPPAEDLEGFEPDYTILHAPLFQADPAIDGGQPKPSYSIDTVRRVKQTLGKSDRLYFLIGMDAFQDIAKWNEADELLAQCDFIVAARPGFSLADVASSLPEKLRPPPAVTKSLTAAPCSSVIQVADSASGNLFSSPCS